MGHIMPRNEPLAKAELVGIGKPSTAPPPPMASSGSSTGCTPVARPLPKICPAMTTSAATGDRSVRIRARAGPATGAGLIRGWARRDVDVSPSHHLDCRWCPPRLPTDDVGACGPEGASSRHGRTTTSCRAPPMPWAARFDMALPALRPSCAGIPPPSIVTLDGFRNIS